MAFNSCDDCFFFFFRVIYFFLTSFYLNRAYFSVSWFLFSRLAHSIFFFSTTSSIFLLFRCMCVCRLRSLQADSHRYAVFRISRSGAFLCSDGGEDGAFFFSPSFPLSPWQLLIVCVLVLRTATRSCEADSPSKIVAMDGFTKRKKKKRNTENKRDYRSVSDKRNWSTTLWIISRFLCIFFFFASSEVGHSPFHSSLFGTIRITPGLTTTTTKNERVKRWWKWRRDCVEN